MIYATYLPRERIYDIWRKKNGGKEERKREEA